LAAARARRVHQDAAHRARRHREEVRPVLPVDLADVDHPQVRLVDERRRLEGRAGPFAGHVVAREAVQLAVDERH